MTCKASAARVSKARGVLYHFVAATDFPFDVEARLAKAKAAGVVTTYDDGRGRSPWFEGPPGAALRALRDMFAAHSKSRSRSEPL